MTKKIANRILVLILAILSFFLCFLQFGAINVVNAQTKSITVFSWEDYIDLGDEEAGTVSILDEFEEQTGISVDYVTFANSEEMYNELIKNPDACDLLCPSEYMIMKMMTEDMIKPFSTPQSYKDFCSPYIKSVFKDLKVSTLNGETPLLSDDESTAYAVGYMWGTMGFIYNKDEGVTAEDLNSWNSISQDVFKNKVTIKDSVRDTYIMALGAVYSEELLALDKSALDYNEKLTEIFNRCDDADIEKVEYFLQELRQNLYGFEVDSGKSDILSGKITVNFAWSGDAAYSIGEGESSGINLGYVVPEEGSNVWFDGFVMPKSVTAEEEKWCVEFLDYMCKPSSAVRNMDYIGYTSVIAGDEVFEYVYDSYNDDNATETVDLKYYFDPTCEGDEYVIKTSDKNGMLFAQYPDYETITRCAVMENFDNDTLVKINAMWNRVKLITLSNIAIVCIVSAALLIIAAGLIYKYREKIFVKRLENSDVKPRKKKCKVVKIEELR